MPDAQKPNTNGWYRVHAIDGSGLDYSTTIFDPERHVIVDGDASDAYGRPLPVGVSVGVSVGVPEPKPKPRPRPKPKTTDKTSANKPEEATK